MIRRVDAAARLGLAGGLVLLGGALVASRGPAAGEIGLVEAVNGLPGAVIDGLEVVMQLGTRAAIVVVAMVAVVLADRRRMRVAAAVLVAGFAAWAAAGPVKEAVDRPRPAAVGAEVVVRDDARGLGYPSSHVSVATATLVAAALATRRPVGAALVLGVIVGVARMAVGVHLPLDVVGGLGLGSLAAALAVWLALR